MFQFLFTYPSAVFRKGQFVLLGKVPGWLLVAAMVAAAIGLALLIRWKLRNAAPELRNWRAWVIWGIQSALVALVLFLLWQPAILVASLASQQNIIAVVVADPRRRSLGVGGGRQEEPEAVGGLEEGVLTGCGHGFQ